MANITTTAPSFVFGYWRPWKENSNAFDSYCDYVKDVSLAKYSADTVGSYINQASEDQIFAINQVGERIGQGFSMLSGQMDDISIKLDETNEQLSFINQNLNLQIEQQRITNLLLENISNLLRVPETEKQRYHHIDLGLKFLANSNKNEDLFADALEELLSAERLMKQDYFVLHRIGLIYLFVKKFIDPIKALEYFKKAGKYASVESDPKAKSLVRILKGTKPRFEYQVILREPGQSKLAVVKLVKELTGLSLKDAKDLVDTAPSLLKKCASLLEAEAIIKEFETIGATLKSGDPINLGYDTQSDDADSIEWLVADSYEKAAFAAYVIGDFQEAVNFSEKVKKTLSKCKKHVYFG